jgi:hypothetical protein
MKGKKCFCWCWWKLWWGEWKWWQKFWLESEPDGGGHDYDDADDDGDDWDFHFIFCKIYSVIQREIKKFLIFPYFSILLDNFFLFISLITLERFVSTMYCSFPLENMKSK